MSQTYVDVLDHEGPWTEQDYMAMPEDGLRVELLDGALLVNPPPGGPHQRLSRNVTWRLTSAAPSGMEVLEGIGVRMHPGRVLIPDITVVTNPGADIALWDAADVAMVVEITSPGSVAADRAVKPPLYAAAGIRHYLHIEPGDDGPAATAFALDGGRYVPVARSGAREVLHLVEPFPVTLDLSQVARATRPAPPP